MSEFFNEENITIERVDYFDLIQGKTNFETVDEDNNIYKKGEILYRYIFTKVGITTEKVMITPIDYLDKFKESRYKECKYHNPNNWPTVPTNKLLKADACVDDFKKIVEIKGTPSFEYKAVEFCKTPEQGMELIHTQLENKLASFKDLGFTIVFRIEPFLEPCTMLDYENSKLKWGYACVAMIGIVKNPYFTDGEITQKERDEYKEHHNRTYRSN